jgi:hypothetical protein
MRCLLGVVLCLGLVASAPAQDAAKKIVEEAKASEQKSAEETAVREKSDEPAAREARYARFREMLTGVRLVGQFTIIGKGKEEQPPRKEEYEIRSVSKLPAGDLWLIQARIKYGDHDVTVPMPLEVKWAAETPVITLDEVTIPGLGTFGARVVFHDQKYAGTWSHGDVGGHLFGTIEKIKDSGDADK